MTKLKAPEGWSDRPLADRLFGWGRRNDAAGGRRASPSAQSDKTLTTRAFARFLAALAQREAPVLLDLGPVVGVNVSFFGERLCCKIFVEDLYANIDAHVKEGRADHLGEFFRTRFPQADASFDGILCWDVLDYMDKGAAQIVAHEMTRLLKPGGALFGFFSTVASTSSEYSRFFIVDESTLRYRSYPAARGRQQVLVNRDINRMFEGLNIAESFLLLTKTREMVFRKPDPKPTRAS
jgi:Methyltransferase domain